MLTFVRARHAAALVIALSLGACGETASSSTSSQVAIPTPTPTTSPQATDVGIPTPSATPVPVPPGQMNAENIAATIATQYAAQAGGATATVICSRTGNFAFVPNDSFSCNFTATNGRSGVITVTLGTGPGQYTWAVGTGASTPTPAAASPTP